MERWGYQDFPKLTFAMLNYTEIYRRASSSISLNDIDARDGCTNVVAES